MPQRTSKTAQSPSANGSAAPEAGAQLRPNTCSGAARVVEDAELHGLFDGLAAFRHLILAVSGGADSMALMHLARRWADRRSDVPSIVVATVDHKLRVASRREAEWVVEQAQALGFEAHVLTWAGEKPTGGIQNAARDARYQLLGELAASLSERPIAIVTAHTEDDQAETLLMRLARGSGVDGLAAMCDIRETGHGEEGILLARPLLRVPGARLRETLTSAGSSWIEDPSNEEDRFERVRVRKAREALGGLGLTNDKLALSARRLTRAKDALEAAAKDLGRAGGLDLNGGMFASFDAATWSSAPEEVRLRLLGRLINSFGGQEEPVNLGQLEGLVASMPAESFEGATLGGAVIARHKAAFLVYRENRPGELPKLNLAAGERTMWDRRFRVGFTGDSGTVEVRALGPRGFSDLRRQLGLTSAPPAAAAATLPGFWRKDQILFVPWFAGVPGADALWVADRGHYWAEFLG
jgi:tRNA(Ile)-lysidine synthase